MIPNDKTFLILAKIVLSKSYYTKNSLAVDLGMKASNQGLSKHLLYLEQNSFIVLASILTCVAGQKTPRKVWSIRPTLKGKMFFKLSGE
jgi:hypothetical protein